MAQKIGNLLDFRKFAEPPEITLIKQFVQDHIGLTPKVTKRDNSYLIIVPSASAAGSLRSQIHLLQRQISDKRLIIRIG